MPRGPRGPGDRVGCDLGSDAAAGERAAFPRLRAAAFKQPHVRRRSLARAKSASANGRRSRYSVHETYRRRRFDRADS